MPSGSPIPPPVSSAPTAPDPSDGVLACGAWRPFPSRTLIMGVLNVTPDSFSDGGRFLDAEAALAHALRMVEEGADLIDIGGESSRPGSDPVEEGDELQRVIPVIRGLARRITVPLSVDTTKAEVARQALDEGVVIVNDITALRGDPAMPELVASRGAGVILMHLRGTPKTMQDDLRYGDVVGEVRTFLESRVRDARAAGISEKQILLDPGIGFGKNLSQNLTLLAGLPSLAAVGRPLVVGVSRKAFIGQILDRPVHERGWGTAAAVALAVQGGVRIVRVHDVAAMRDVVRVADAILKSRADG